MSEDFVPGPTDESYVDEQVEDSGQAPESSEEFAHGADGAVPEDKSEKDVTHERTSPTDRVSQEMTEDL